MFNNGRGLVKFGGRVYGPISRPCKDCSNDTTETCPSTKRPMCSVCQHLAKNPRPKRRVAFRSRLEPFPVPNSKSTFENEAPTKKTPTLTGMPYPR